MKVIEKQKKPPLFNPSSCGFTLIEVIVSIAIFIIIIGAVSWAIISFYKSNRHILDQSFAISSAGKGVSTMVREIREATYSDTGAYPVVEVGYFNFTIYSDTDYDNNIEKIRYFLDGSDLKKGVTQASGDPLVYNPADEHVEVLSDNVRNTALQYVFMYYDEVGDEVVNLDEVTDIVLIKVSLVVNVMEDAAPNEFTLRSTAQMRNLKTNL